MITIIVDQRPGERDLLAGRENHILVIKSLEGEKLFERAPPKGGWTFKSIQEQQQIQNAQMGDAFLGECWIGSSEV